jgi:NAD(P)-dependent dehydrogenase (short-subunit alcohol dehydrogenase family)
MKTIIITGASSGIGEATTLYLAKAGHRILMLCRDSKKSEQVHNDVLEGSGNKDVYLFRVDLSDPELLSEVVTNIREKYHTIDVLVNNAGIFKAKRPKPPDQVGLVFKVNFLALFILSETLLENLEASGEGRIINLISDVYKRGFIDLDDLLLEETFRPSIAYCNAELAKALYTVELADRLADRKVTVNGLHPGTIATDLYRESPGFMTKMMDLFSEKPHKAAERVAHLALSEEVGGVTGKFFIKSKQQEFSISPQDESIAEKLCRKASQLTGTPMG